MDSTDQKNRIMQSLESLRNKYGVVDDPDLNVKQSLQDLLVQAQDIEYGKGIYNANKLLAAHHIILNQEQDAYVYLEAASHSIEKYILPKSNYAGLANVYIMYYADMLGDYEKAFELLEWGTGYADNAIDRANLRGNFGAMCVMNGAYQKGIDMLCQVRAYYLENDMDHYLMYVYENLGAGYLGLGDYELAIGNYRQSYELALKYKNHQMETVTVIGIAKTMIAKDQKDQAITFLKANMPNVAVSQSGTDTIDAALLLSQLYYDMGDYRQSGYTMSQYDRKMQQCLNNDLRTRYYRLLSEIKEKLHRYEEAKLYAQMSDDSKTEMMKHQPVI